MLKNSAYNYLMYMYLLKLSIINNNQSNFISFFVTVLNLMFWLQSGSCESLMTGDSTVSGVPGVISACVRYLEDRGLRTLGIFRVSSSKKRVRQLREELDCGRDAKLDDESCPHDIATLLKEYLRDLPEPLLSRELYQPFVFTQRIRNRRLQLEAVRHLVQLLPPPNRDTLAALLAFLANVAANANDGKDPSTGDWCPGNKMDATNLATVFAPNILHCLKPGAAATKDGAEDRIDVINVVRTMIDHYSQLFTVPAELLDEVYIYMMDTDPDLLDRLLARRDIASPITVTDE